MNTPDPNVALGEVPQDLLFGQRFRVTRRAGPSLEGVSLSRIPGGVYARLEGGDVVRVLAGEVDWETCELQGPTVGLRPGDALLIESPAGSLRGELVELRQGGELVLSLPHGAQLPFPVSPIKRAYLLVRRDAFEPGDPFEVQSRSGNVYTGVVQQRLGPDRIRVELDLGHRAELRLSRLRLETAAVRLPIPAAHLRGERARLPAPARTRSARLKSPPREPEA